jgi:hypothetical protein
MRFPPSTLKISGLSVFCLAASAPAYGYIDPGTGSLIVQSVIGAIAAIGVTLKLYWHKLKVFFLRKDDETTDKEKTAEK